jgi:polysaccharide export outer membrane protein
MPSQTAGSGQRRLRWVWGALAVILNCQPAVAEYRAGPGDVIDISVLGIPELQRRSPVEPDGTITFPVMGNISVQGLTLRELRVRIKAALSGRVVTLRSASDTPTPLVINIDEVAVSVATYRPVFVNGAVAKPGEYPYRGQMAIRDLVASAGGYFRAITDIQGMLTTLDLRAELESLWLDIAKQRARVWRLRAEIDEKIGDQASLNQSVPSNAPINRAALARISALAAEHLQTRQTDYRRERESLEVAIAQLTKEISATDTHVAEDEKAYKVEVAELARLTSLSERGVVNAQRLADARRDMMAASTRVLVGSTRLNDARRQKIERQLQLYKLSGDRRTALYQELETTTASLSELQVRVRRASAKLQFLAGKEFTSDKASQPQATFLVHRRTPAGNERLTAEEDFELLPGDAVDVVSRNGIVFAEPSQ